MRKFPLLAIALLIAAAPAFAGGEKCSESAQACLNHWSESTDKGWTGIKTEKAEDGSVMVKEVLAGSPAATAGFQAGDVLMAINGASMTDMDAVKKAKGAWKAGQSVSYTLRRSGAEKTMAMTLAKMPQEMFTSMLGTHMIENHVDRKSVV